MSLLRDFLQALSRPGLPEQPAQVASALSLLATKPTVVAADFPSIAAGAIGTVDIAVPGVEVGDAVLATPSAATAAGFVWLPARVQSAGLVRLSALNTTGAPIDAASQSVTVVRFSNGVVA